MSDLRQLAEQAKAGPKQWQHYLSAVPPDELLALLDERDRLRAALVEAIGWVRADIDVITKDWLEQGRHPESRQKIEEAEETARRFSAILNPEG